MRNNLLVFTIALILLLAIHTVKIWINISYIYYVELVALAIVLGNVVLWLLDSKKLFKINAKYIRKILIYTVLIYTSLFTLLTILRYLSYTSNVLDLGTFLQPLSNTMRGRLMAYTSMELPFNEMCRFGNHFEFIYLPLSLFSNVFDGPYFFLILQTLFLAMAAFPLYRIGLKVTNEGVVALFIALSYLGYTGLHYLNIFDIHGDAFALLFIFLAYDALLRERKKYWIYLILSFLCKEYVALSGIGLGLTIFIAHKKRKTGLITAIISVSYFLSVHYLIMPLFNKGNLPLFEISRHYQHIGGENGLWGVFVYLISHPVKFLNLFILKENIESIFYMFFPVAFLSFLSPFYLFGAFPIICKDMLFGMNIGNHRLAITIPYIFISLSYSLKKIKSFQERENWVFIKEFTIIVYLISFTIVAIFFYGPTPLGHRFWREKRKYFIDDKDRSRNRIIKNIPENAIISVSGHIFPHVAKRKVCYIYPRPWCNETKSFNDVRYICIDTVDTKLVYPEMKNFTNDALKIITDHGFIKIKEENGIYLFKKIK